MPDDFTCQGKCIGPDPIMALVSGIASSIIGGGGGGGTYSYICVLHY